MVKYCPRCGYPNPDDAVYCMRCGAKFPDITNQPVFTQQTSQPTQQYPTQQPTASVQPSQQPTVSPTQPQQSPQQPTIFVPPSQPTQQYPTQQPTANVPPPPPPGLITNYQPQQKVKHRKIPARLIIGISIIAAILLLEFFVILPLVTPNPVILTTSSAQSIFGGTWIVDKSHTASISVSGSTATLYYLNGSQISTSMPVSGVTGGSIETLIGSQVTGETSPSVELTITKLFFNSNSAAMSFYNSISGSNNGGSINGYTYYIQNSNTLIAVKNNYVLIIIIHGASLNSNEVYSLLQTIS